MTGAGDRDPTLELLVSQGLVTIVRADQDLTIVSARGKARGAAQPGLALCEALPALFGQEADIRALVVAADQRVVIANVSVRNRDGRAERFDFIVVYDALAAEFVTTIVPSHANDEAALQHERDLRERLHLEAQVAAQARAIEAANAALRRTNADLVNFTRIISHDLKAPMRAIRYSADDIEAALPQAGTGGPADALEELRGHAKRMSQMVSDLLAYSRLEDKAGAAGPVDTRALVTTIAKSLPRPAGLNVIIAGQWPEVVTIGALLDVVVRNLIDNAIKHHDRDAGEVIVSADQRADRLDITITDDGPGIPAKYQKAVLRPFVRIDKGRTDGSGMGLSMVHKLVTDHGGTFAIGDRPDGRRGTCVQVAWPLTNMAF